MEGPHKSGSKVSKKNPKLQGRRRIKVLAGSQFPSDDRTKFNEF
jgi:hypothetical protein